MWLASFQLIVDFMALLGTGAMIFIMVFTVISISELEAGGPDPRTVVPTVNKLRVPEYMLQMGITVLCFLSLNWVELLINLPPLVYNYRRLSTRTHLLNEVNVYEGEGLSVRKKHSMLKLGYYITCFFFYLYRLITILIEQIFAENLSYH